MSYFRVNPIGLQEQSCEMQKAYCHMCAATGELASVIRTLQTMSCYDGTIQTLRRISQKGEEQYIRIRQYAKTLDHVAELYTQTELKNQSDRVVVKRTAQTNVFPSLAARTDISQDSWMALQPIKMLSFAEELFGSKISIPSVGNQGGN